MKTDMRIGLETRAASGLVDMLIVVATVALLVFAALPMIAGRGVKSKRISCISNLREVGIANRLWSIDHGNELAWNVTTMSNGVMEIAMSGNIAALMACMSNELNSPRILFCPADTMRTRESDFAKLSNRNISYFIGLDADETRPQTILSGDRNISGGVLTSNRVMFVINTSVLVWGKDIHSHAGNVGLADGSAQQLSGATLQKQITAHLQSFTSAPSSQRVRLALP